MRERGLVKGGSVCQDNLYADGPKTVAQAKKVGPSQCPHFDKCQRGLGTGAGKFQCVMMMGRIVATGLLDGGTITAEIEEFKGAMRQQGWPGKGFVFSRDRKTFVYLTDRDEIAREVEAFAHTVLDDQNGQPADQSKPGQREVSSVGGSFEDVVAHSIDSETGAIDLLKVQRLEGRFGSNGGRGCDVTSGPCSCGAWH